MRRFTPLTLSILLSTTIVLPMANGQRPTANTKRPMRAGTKAPTVSSQLEEMRSMLADQQRRIQQLEQQLRQRDEAVQQAQQQASQAATAASEAASRADAANAAALKTSQGFTEIQSTVTDLRSNSTAAALELQETQKRIGESPASIHFRGITITPGGFIEGAAVFRNRNENASVNSASGVNNIPFTGSPNGQLSEFRFDARQSRLSLLGEGKVGSTRLTGYYEVDFLGAAPTANENQSNSFNLRQRQLWGQAAFANGFTFTGGQQWSLFTLTRKAMENRNEFLPMTINAQYVVGYDWSRQPGLRVMKNFNNRLWLGFALENASTVLSVQQFGAAAPALVTTAGSLSLGGVPIYGFNTSANAVSPNGNFTLANTPGANGVSTNQAPDLVAKVTFEPGWGHYEIKGIARFFRDRYKGNTDTTTGGGLGLGAVLPLVKSKVDFIAEGSLGNGIGRYGSGGGQDVTLRLDGTVRPIRSYHALLGPEVHVGKNLDIYAYAGAEYYQRTAYFANATSAIGYGLPLANNTGCNLAEQTTTTAPPACNGQTRAAWEFTPGFYYRFYKGPAGTFQWGIQYSYSARALWSGIGGLAAGSAGLGPDSNISQVYTAFRYVP